MIVDEAVVQDAGHAGPQRLGPCARCAAGPCRRSAAGPLRREPGRLARSTSLDVALEHEGHGGGVADVEGPPPVKLAPLTRPVRSRSRTARLPTTARPLMSVHLVAFQLAAEDAVVDQGVAVGARRSPSTSPWALKPRSWSIRFSISTTLTPGAGPPGPGSSQPRLPVTRTGWPFRRPPRSRTRCPGRPRSPRRAGRPARWRGSPIRRRSRAAAGRPRPGPTAPRQVQAGDTLAQPAAASEISRKASRDLQMIDDQAGQARRPRRAAGCPGSAAART